MVNPGVPGLGMSNPESANKESHEELETAPETGDSLELPSIGESDQIELEPAREASIRPTETLASEKKAEAKTKEVLSQVPVAEIDARMLEEPPSSVAQAAKDNAAIGGQIENKV